MIRLLTVALTLACLVSCQSTPAASTQTVKVQATAPTAGYAMRITQVYAKGPNLLVLAEAVAPEGMAAQVLTQIGDAAQVRTDAPNVICYVLGPSTLRTPNGGTHRYVVITDRKVWEKVIEDAKAVPFTRI